MTLKKATDSDKVLHLIEEFKRGSSLSNCFLMGTELVQLVQAGLLSYSVDGPNAFILEDKGNCYRIHYILNDTDSGFSLVLDKPFMLEILFRGKDGEPESAVAYWSCQGFSRNLVRNNLAAKFSDLRITTAGNSNEIYFAETEEEGGFAKTLFNNAFDPYSGDLVTSEEIEGLLKNRQILIASHNGKNCGALHFYNVGKCAWIGHVAICPEVQGHGYGSALVSEFIRLNHVDDKSRYSLWVQAQNRPAVVMYERFGFKYTGKSSLSMIKRNT